MTGKEALEKAWGKDMCSCGNCKCGESSGEGIRCAERASNHSCNGSGILHSVSQTINLRHPNGDQHLRAVQRNRRSGRHPTA